MILRIAAAALLFLFSFFAFLLRGTPAAWLAARAAPTLAANGIDLGEVRGSAWRGAGEIVLHGTDLGRLQWTASPWPLLRGRIAADVSVAGNGLRLRAAVQADRSATVFHRIDGRAGLPLMASLVGLPTGLQGTLVVDLATVRFGSGGALQAADGTLRAENASLPELGVDLGTLTLTLKSADGTIRGVLAGKGGDLDLAGTLVLSSAGSYTLHTTLKPHPGKDRLADGLAALLGAPDADGRYHYDASGTLTP